MNNDGDTRKAVENKQTQYEYKADGLPYNGAYAR